MPDQRIKTLESLAGERTAEIVVAKRRREDGISDELRMKRRHSFRPLGHRANHEGADAEAGQQERDHSSDREAKHEVRLLL